MGLDAQRAVVVAGDGVVARYPGLLCVARCPDPGPVRQLLALCERAAGENPGRGLARTLAAWLVGSDAPGDALQFGTLAEAGERIAVFLSGAVDVAVMDGGLTVSGADSATWTDRLLPVSDSPVLLALTRAAPPVEHLGQLLDLRAGVVPGAGVVLQGAAVRRRPAPSPAYEPPPPASPSRQRPPVEEWSVDRPGRATNGEDFSAGEWFGGTAEGQRDRDEASAPSPSSAWNDEPRRRATDGEPRRAAQGVDPWLPDWPPSGRLAPEESAPAPAPRPADEERPPWGSPSAPSVPIAEPSPSNGTSRGIPRSEFRADRPRPLNGLPRSGPRIEPPRAPMNGLAPHAPRPDGTSNGEADDGTTGRHAQIDVVAHEPVDRPTAAREPAVPQAESEPSRVEAHEADVAVESAPQGAPTADAAQADDSAQVAAPSAAPADDESTSDSGSEEPTPHVPRPHVAVPRAPRRSEQILGVEPEGPKPPPLEIGTPVGAPPARSSTNGQRDEPQARGHLCARGHLNDPRSQFCVLCGVRMNERTGVLVVGARPPLGLLVLDDGATYTVDAEYLVGRMPEADQRVQTGMMRAIVVEDRSGAVSRVHAELRVNGWDVLLSDSGSRNGTFVAGPSDSGWAPLPPGRSRRLVPGTRIRMGGRTFVFESPSGVR